MYQFTKYYTRYSVTIYWINNWTKQYSKYKTKAAFVESSISIKLMFWIISLLFLHYYHFLSV